MGQKEVDLPQLFSDVSRTISGISNIMGAGPSQADTPTESSSVHTSSSVMGGLFGNTCFKACGMEDIQFAARSAGEMLNTLRICIITSTIATVFCLVILTGTILYLTCKKAPPKRFPLPAFFRDVFPSEKENNARDNQNT